MYFFLLSAFLVSAIPQSAENVHTVRIGTYPGTIEITSAVSISPRHALSLSIFSSENKVTVETEEGNLCPDTMIVSPDLGIVVMIFEDDVFDDYCMPSQFVPEIGDELTIVGNGLNGILVVEGETREQYPDGSFLISTDLRDGMMGAAVFSSDGDCVGLITGILRTSSVTSDSYTEHLVLYPSQIWYMWPKLIVLQRNMNESSFGVMARSSISLTPDDCSGIHIVSVTPDSRAWKCGLRPGDLITHINGTRVYHPETLRGLLLLLDDTLDVHVIRGDFQRDLSVAPQEE
ncbi:MAG: PDZ domain-containing protein, partial [Candidatus Aegiribacteria sp.]|nr:PDZ domain-containing protein [Candidatus Aegiribacteria sp.]MBD3294241.1 PDZ domain-containing protein [Candidatus Fermentibacteria bacterium]